MRRIMTDESKTYGDVTAASVDSTHYELRLYVIASTPTSMRAVANIRRICDEHLPGRYTLEVVDLAENPSLAQEAQVIAAPTLIKKLPLPLRRFIGDLSKTDRIVVGLDLRGE